MRLKIAIISVVLFHFINCVQAQVWQWSVQIDSVVSPETNDHPTAFLWIPENCRKINAVVFTQHNMVEEGMLEHRLFRKTMTELGIAEIWVTPNITITFDFHKDAAQDFNRLMQLLANVSGYDELKDAPVIPMGHSALASFPWNFAAWDPQRTLAVVSVHGDAPQTNFTGSGRPNPDWGERNVDGIPSLFIMAEGEWWEDRITPAFAYIAKHPKSVISLFADAGHGHFDYSDAMVEYVCLFIRKAAKARLSSNDRSNRYRLKPLLPENGWLMDRWHKDSLPNAIPAPYKHYKGDRRYASWVFDKEMADATERFYARARSKINQSIGIKQRNEIIKPTSSHANYQLKFQPIEDGLSFHVSAFFSDTSRMQPVTGHANSPLFIDRICGPVKKINDTTFQLNFYRMGFNNARRSNDIWLVAHNKGDTKYKSAVLQMNLRFPWPNKEGAEQSINFPAVNDIKQGTTFIDLKATSSSSLPVRYYVKEGPAYIKDQRIHFTAIPPKTKFPLKVTVVAWQYGVPGKFQSAKPVERSFYLQR